MKPVMWSFGMQSRPMFHVGDNPDIEGAVRSAKDAGIKDAVIFGKDHTGLCFHPTEYGIEHPQTKIDLTGEITAELHRNGMRAFAYFNLGMDGEMGRRHPDWLQESSPGKYLITADHFANICVFGEFLHQYALPVLLEMFEKYHIDGLFLDTMSAFGYCCCPKCKASFEKATKRPLPLPGNDDNPDWEIYGRWQYNRSAAFMNELRSAIFEKYPDAEIIFNHIGGPNFPFAMPGIEDGIVSCDPPAFYPWVSLYSSYLSTLKHGGDIFIERFARGWGDRCDLNDKTLQYKCAAIFAHRQRFCVGDRMHPDARLADGSAEAMKKISKVWKQFNKALPDRLSRSSDFLLVYPECYRSGFEKSKFSRPGQKTDFYGPMLGAFCFLLDSGFSFQTVPEFALQNNLTKDKFVIISGAEALSEKSNALLEEFVRKGGKVLFSGKLPVLKDGSFPTYYGIKAAEPSYHTCIYLPGKVKGEKILVRGRLLNLELSGAATLLNGYPQDYAKELKDTPYPYYNASSPEVCDIPLLTVNHYGKGAVYFLNCGLLEDYADSILPAQLDWGKELLKKLAPSQKFRLDGKSGNVELVPYCDKNGDSVCVLINHGGREGSLRTLFVTEQITDPQPAYKVKLLIRSKETVEVYGDNKLLPVDRKGKYIVVPVTMDSTWKFIRIKKMRDK